MRETFDDMLARYFAPIPMSEFELDLILEAVAEAMTDEEA